MNHLKELEEGLTHTGAVGPPDQGPRTDTRVAIRVASPSDADWLRGMFSRSSSESIYRRFHTPFSKVPEWMLALMLDEDRSDRESLVAVADGEIVGHAMYVRLGSSAEAEMAIIVEDGWQSRGIGKSLLSGLAQRAGLRGIETFTGEVLGENRPMLGLAAAMFTGIRRTIQDGAYHVRMPLEKSGPEPYPTQTLHSAA